MLDYSKIEIPRQRNRGDTGIVDLFTPSVSRQNINMIYTNKNSSPAYVKMNPFAFNHIINNLIDNVKKYAKSKIEISLLSNSKEVIIIITDDGPGIPDKVLINIFLPFYQQEQNHTPGKGIGMGLYIVKHILDSINAKISIKNREKGTGSSIQYKKYSGF